MAGYNWRSGKSNNAVKAESDGRMVATKFAQYVKRWPSLKGCTAADIKEACEASEWHHSSKFFNVVDYYDPVEILSRSESRQELRDVVANRKLFQELLRKHGTNGYMQLQFRKDGALHDWHTVHASDKYNTCYLNRMVCQVEQGFANDED
tara:strand:+ start:484 stop:933 length:450 start_codon:yes stop_codon:yes gene_type:complete